MSLINCPECGKEISDKALICVWCGYPIKEMHESNKEENQDDVVDISKDYVSNLIEEVGFHKERIISVLQNDSGKTYEECKELVNKPFEEYVINNVNLEEIMKLTDYNKVMSIKMLSDKTGLTLKEAKALFDKPYMKVYPVPMRPEKVKEIKKRQCKICHTVFSSDNEFCTNCYSKDTVLYVEKKKSFFTPKTYSLTLRCPQCGSTHIALKTKGISTGKAVVGAMLLGPLGAVYGLDGANKTIFVCLDCGKEWKSKR